MANFHKILLYLVYISIISLSCNWSFSLITCFCILIFRPFRITTSFCILIFRHFSISTSFFIQIFRYSRIRAYFCILIFKNFRMSTCFCILIFGVTTGFFKNLFSLKSFSISSLSLSVDSFMSSR